MPTPEEAKQQLAELIDTLSLLIAQAQAYQGALSSENYQAKAAIATLEKLAKLACNEAKDLADCFANPSQTPIPLSARELTVLKLAADGLTNKEIAYRLGLSERTIQFHLNSIYHKTDTSSRTEATAFALKKSWF